MARSFSVSLVTCELPSMGDAVDVAELRRLLPDVEVVTTPGPHRDKRRAQALSLFSQRSWQWGRFAMPAYTRALRAVVEQRSARLVHFDDLGVALSGPVPGTIGVFAPHNVEHRIMQGSAATDAGVRAAFAAVEWRKIRREEQAAWRRMSLCLAVSDVDAGVMRDAGASRVELCPNGVDPVDQLDFPSRSDGQPLRLLFVGTVSYRPYERGIAWFVREVLPRLRERVPVELDVVGSPPLKPVSAAGVRYHGRVPALQPWYERAHAVLVPVFEGSGTRLKMIEAMAYGRPVVSTPLGSEGLPVRADEHFLEVTTAEQFSDALETLAHDMASRDGGLGEMLERAREAIRPLYWPNIVSGLVDLYRLELDREASRS
ncbi:MAG TPA: glycosyltransferase family 4 protein [Solirubrobacteraceae bacterium]|nr:glycosyltransferase family 4 protein [Solirubrobacteraceae bacterium]